MESARVVAVVPVYRPDSGFPARLAGILREAGAAVVVDDGSSAEPPPAAAGIEFIAQADNRGIAAAINTGIARARLLGATYVLTVDQDTELQEGYVTAALETFSRSGAARIGAVVADVINGVPSVPTWVSPDGVPLAPEAIQSGMLVSVACLDDAGEFDESLFIDSVDREFCHRIRARGWAVAIGEGTSISHSIGRRQPLRSGGTYEWHEPFRQYYIARNGIAVIRRFWSAERDWAKAMLRDLGVESWRLARNGPRRFKHALATAVGLWHGAFGVGGRIPRRVERLLG